MEHPASDQERTPRQGAVSRRTRFARPAANNRPSIGYALHSSFPEDDQPSLPVFAQVMAHRIRGLLTGIEGFTDLLLDTTETVEQRELGFRILESTSRIEGILSDLQHYNDPLEAHFHKISGGSVAHDVLSALADSEMDRVLLSSSVPEDIHVRADETLMRQALITMLRNAFDAEGLTESKIFFVAELSQEKTHVEYSVRNSGSRISAFEASQIFQPFFTTKSANLGLGLTLARRIARIHKGDLSLSSPDGAEFAEFKLRIPVYREDRLPDRN